MPSPFDPLVDVIHATSRDSWKEKNEHALTALFGTRYAKRAENSVRLRAPDMKGSDTGVPYAAYIHPANADSGAYGGMCFVIFPVEEGPSLVAMCVGTQGLAPDEAILGRPGHARKIYAICSWLNQRYGHGQPVAWAKHDPTRIDIGMPEVIQRNWSSYERVFKKYGNVLYAAYQPNEDRSATTVAVSALLDVMFEERGHLPLTQYREDRDTLQAAWFSHLLPEKTRNEIVQTLQQRRYVVIQGPPGTGKTRMAQEIIAKDYQGAGQSIQFHPNTTYENFIGGLAPVEHQNGNDALGFRFAPKRGFLMEAAALALSNPTRPYLLHIDEINRADLGKVLGEAIYLFEPDATSPRRVALAHDFGSPFFRNLQLPENLHILGTMNSADRSIAILDVAVRRRFAFLPLWPSSDVVANNGCELGTKAFQELVSIFIEHAPEEALSLMPGHSYFLGRDEEQTRTKLKTSLVPLLHEYLAQGYVGGFTEPIRAYLQKIESL